MTSEVHEDFRGHLDKEVTDLATLIEIERKDGKFFYLTSHDEDIHYEGNLYHARGGFDRSSMTRSSDLSPDDIEIEGMAVAFLLDNEDIRDEELSVGLFDGARIRIQTVVWSDLTIPAKKDMTYIAGPVVQGENGMFRLSVMSLTEYLQQGIVRSYTVKCQHDLGDTRCRVPIHPPIIARDAAYSVGDFVRIPTDRDTTETAPNDAPVSEAFENRIYECVEAGTTLAANEDTITDIFDFVDQFEKTINGTFDFAESGSSITWQEGNFETEGFATGWTVNFPDNGVNDGTYTITGVADDVITVAEALTDQSDFAGDLDAVDDTKNVIRITNGDFTDTDIEVGWKIEFIENAVNDSIFTIEEIAADYIFVTEDVTNQADFDGVAESYLEYDTTVGEDTTDGTAVFRAQQAWTRHGEVLVAESNRFITIDIDEPRAVGAENDWFNYGLLTFETGANAGFSVEIKIWDANASQLHFFPQMPPFDIEVGDKFRIYPGCDKRDATCAAKFDNILNHLGFAFIPGQRVISEVDR